MGELKPLHIPEELREALAVEAASKGVSVDAIAAQAVEAYLSAIRTRKFFEARAGSSDPEWLMRFLDRKDGEVPRLGDELPSGYKRTH